MSKALFYVMDGYPGAGTTNVLSTEIYDFVDNGGGTPGPGDTINGVSVASVNYVYSYHPWVASANHGHFTFNMADGSTVRSQDNDEGDQGQSSGDWDRIAALQIFAMSDGSYLIAPATSSHSMSLRDELEANGSEVSSITLTGNSSGGPWTGWSAFAEVCFVAGTMIETRSGETCVEELTVGQEVRTLDHGYQPVLWTGGKINTLPGKNAPIRISAGSLGSGYPLIDTYVSPQHRVLLRSCIVERVCDTSEVLVPAKKLTELDGVEQCDANSSVEYRHILCKRHELILSNGIWTETLFLGPQAIMNMGPDRMHEISLVLDDTNELPMLAQDKARGTPKGSVIRKLVRRHLKNKKPLIR